MKGPETDQEKLLKTARFHRNKKYSEKLETADSLEIFGPFLLLSAINSEVDSDYAFTLRCVLDGMRRYEESLLDDIFEQCQYLFGSEVPTKRMGREDEIDIKYFTDSKGRIYVWIEYVPATKEDLYRVVACFERSYTGNSRVIFVSKPKKIELGRDKVEKAILNIEAQINARPTNPHRGGDFSGNKR